MKASKQSAHQFAANKDYKVTFEGYSDGYFHYTLTSPDGSIKQVRKSKDKLSDANVRRRYHEVMIAGKFNSGELLGSVVLSTYTTLKSLDERVTAMSKCFVPHRDGLGVTFSFDGQMKSISHHDLLTRDLSSIYADIINSPVAPYVTSKNSVYSGKPNKPFMIALKRYIKYLRYLQFRQEESVS